MIEDKELRELFRIECEEHLQCLDDGLLSLEQQPANQSLLEDIFRAAHSIKGSARMLGLIELQSLAHKLEDALGEIKNNALTVDKNLAATLYQKLTHLRQLVAEAVDDPLFSDEVSATSVTEVQLPEPEIKPATPVITTEVKITPPLVADSINTLQTKEQPEAKNAGFKINTLRVDPQRLDILLTHAGELAVTNTHIVRRLHELDALLENCESWMRVVKLNGLQEQNENIALHYAMQMQHLLTQLRSGLYEDSHRLDFISTQLGNGIRTIRLLPFSTLFSQFPRLVYDLSQTLHKDVNLVLEGADVVADKRILEELKDPLMHLLRNAISHGLEESAVRLQRGKPERGKVVIRATQTAIHINLQVQDDGCGLDIDKIKRIALKQGLCSEEQLALMNNTQIQALILLPGFTTTQMITEISGRGVGLDVVRFNVEKLKGSIHIDSTVDKGTTFTLQLPLTLATLRVQIVSVQTHSYALPLEAVQFSRRIKTCDLFTMEGRQTVSLEGRLTAVAYLSDLLELHNTNRVETDFIYVIFLQVADDLLGLIVDELRDETEVMLKTQSKLLKRVRNVSATTILVSGEVCPILNPYDLLKSMYKHPFQNTHVAVQPKITPVERKKTLLLVEDSITTRTQEKRILESAGYQVVTAVDGLDGYTKFQSGQFDGIISDIEMPNMNGFVLTEAIRKDKKHADIPIILVTLLSSEADQRHGLEAGANAYLVKSTFEQKILLDCLARLV